jgi:two-component system, chemotaxis family, sensor kinase CheA
MSGSDMNDDMSESQGEFAAEAQETIEAFGRILLDLEAQQKAGGAVQPDSINDAFRVMHTLKGISSLFGKQDIAELSHELEEILDSIRMGRQPLNATALDLLFDAVDLMTGLVSGEVEDHSTGMTSFRERLLQRAAGASPDEFMAQPAREIGLSPDLLQTLTEYEEHRLQENLLEGRRLFLVHGDFDVTTIDSELEELRNKLMALGEVITCLPSDEMLGEDRIGLDLMLASNVDVSQVDQVAESVGSRATEISSGAAALPAPAPQATTEQEPKVTAEPVRESIRSLSQTVRVNIDKLDRLMNTVGELTLVRNELTEVLHEVTQDRVDLDTPRRFVRHMRTFHRRLDDLQRGILEVRMVPLNQVFDKLARVVRKLSREFDKEIAFYVSGGDTEIDKLIVEELSDPLMHIMRNCIDHGVESTIDRTAKGKPAEGMVALRAYPRGNHVVIEVEDDGAGIDPEVILESALRRGFVDDESAQELSRRELLNLIFLPGFTTRREAGAISGRGVGMDVVKTNLLRLSGLVDVISEPGMGTRFTLTLPITLAIIRALLVQVSGATYAIPLSTVLEIYPIKKGHVTTIDGREVVTLRGATLPLLRLEPLFGLEPPPSPAMDSVGSEARGGREYVVVVGMAQHRVGVVVNEMEGQQDIVIKSLGKALSDVPGIAGATELGGRRTVLVLDIAALVDEFISG